MAKIAFVLADDYEDAEFRRPYETLREHGHETVVIGMHAGEEVEGKRRGDRTVIEMTADDVDAAAFDGLVIPGGYSPDKLRLDPNIVAFVAGMIAADKPVAAICHAPQLLIEADALRGRTLTAWPSVRKDVENAGGKWVDEELVEDGNLITSRMPEDLDAFCSALLARFG